MDIILSIVPPRDALATARRVADASHSAASLRKTTRGPLDTEIVYIDLNAVSPKTITNIDGLFVTISSVSQSQPSLARRLTRSLSSATPGSESPSSAPITIKFLDGAIIGSPPSLIKADKSKSDESSALGESSSSESDWKRPSIPLSGPYEALLSTSLLEVLRMRFISTKIGTASSLKACFASLTKGFTALSILSYTTAATCGVLPELKAHLDEIVPGLGQRAEAGLTSMPPKAYRWVDEMREIGRTFSSSGGMKAGGEIFDSIAEVYRFIAEDTVLGHEKVGKRKRGTTAEDVAEAIEEGIQKKMQKKEGKEEKLELAWRGSWGL